MAAVGEAKTDLEAPTRGAAAPGEAVPNSLGSANRQSRQQGGGDPERAGTLFADAGRSVGPRGAPKPGSVSPALFHGEKERLNRNCSTGVDGQGNVCPPVAYISDLIRVSSHGFQLAEQ